MFSKEKNSAYFTDILLIYVKIAFVEIHQVTDTNLLKF